MLCVVSPMKNNGDFIIEEAVREITVDGVNEVSLEASKAAEEVGSVKLPPVIVTTAKNKQIDLRQLDRLKNEDFDKMRMFGKHNNVPMTLKQYIQLQLMTTAYNYYIDKVSDFIKNATDKKDFDEKAFYKKYFDFFGVIKNNIAEKKDAKKGKDPLGKPFPDPTTAYDICCHEMMLRYSIPKVVKRDKTKRTSGDYRRYDEWL